MRSLSTAHINALQYGFEYVDIFEFQINSTTYRESNSDIPIIFEGNTYTPGMVKSISDVEITSEPKVNEIKLVIDANDPTYKPLFLSGSWMNQPFKHTRLTYDLNFNLVGSYVVFQGLFSDVSLDESSQSLDISITSIWADFEKSAGIKTNVASQQRFYPNDTGFRHAADARKVIYWGQNAPNQKSGSAVGAGGSNGRSPILPPTVEF